MYSKLLCYNELNIEAPVAQLDRASVYGTEGRGFEPLQARFHKCWAVNSLPLTALSISSSGGGRVPAARQDGYSSCLHLPNVLVAISPI